MVVPPVISIAFPGLQVSTIVLPQRTVGESCLAPQAHDAYDPPYIRGLGPTIIKVDIQAKKLLVEDLKE